MPSVDPDGVTPSNPAPDRPEAAARFRDGTQIRNYRILARLGRGGMGEVFHARDETLHRDVALKFLAPNLRNMHDAVIRMKREAEAAQHISHPNVVRIYKLETLDDDEPFIVAEYVPGSDLSTLIFKGVPPPRAAISILRQIASGLEATHAAGVVHRDIKPQNIRLREDSSVVIVDFGLGKVFRPDFDGTTTTDARVTSASHVLGTIAYTAPEQLTDGANVSGSADVFSFGVLAFELLTSKLPFEKSNPAATIGAILSEEAPDVRSLRRDISEPLARLIAECLAKQANSRPTAAVVAARIGAFPDTSPPEQIFPAPPARMPDYASMWHWKSVLREIVDGQQDAAIHAVGSLEEVVRTMIANAPDPLAAEQAFIQALDQELAMWRPGAAADARRMDILLDLVSLHLPASGFTKACEVLQSEALALSEPTTLLRAMKVLTRYFPLPPIDGNANFAFRHYVRILVSLIDSETLAAPAAARLIELGIADSSNEHLRRRARRDDGFLRELVAQFVSSPHSREHMKTVFELSVEIGASGLETFLVAVERAGGTAIVGEGGVSVLGSDSAPVVDVPVDPSKLDLYTVARWHLLANDRTFIDQLLADEVP